MDNVREKLVELLNEADDQCAEMACSNCGYVKNPVHCKSFCFADHLLANGVTVLPCKVGDAVWGIKKYNRGYAVRQGEVYQMYFGEDMRLCICVKNVCRGEWGANVFATQKEAEQALITLPKGE